MTKPADAAIRQRALDPSCSFIVQAPAGSGKTELLTRRVLTLLCSVDEPEQILAITFTRKAASEMRQRVIEMLDLAASGNQVDSPYQEEGLALARLVLQRDEALDWRLVHNAQRLNIRTIDSLATQLAYRLPVTSALGAPVGVIEKADALYQDVAGRFIESNLGSLEHVLLQLGNKLDRAQTLLANLLANRDQWKRHVYGAGKDYDALREALESMLAELVESRLTHLCSIVPAELPAVLIPRLRMASEFLLADAKADTSSLSPGQQQWLSLETLPAAELSDLAAWRDVAQALLTNDSKPRKSLTVKQGFPAEKEASVRGCDKALLKTHKQQMLKAIDIASSSAEFLAALAEVRQLPEPAYSDEQWTLLCELLEALPDLLVELQWAFAQQRQVDFAEIAERAQRALGSPDEPTDLALAMDLSLRHVLVDEFQDTSQTQFSLFARLVGGWDAADGRTFFAVGDPMQSIYRFRDGDVTLFEHAKCAGVGPVSLEPLTLSVNFRAATGLIDWVNETFARLFPDQANPVTGAVAYSASQAFLDTRGRIEVHPLVDDQKATEPALVARLCKKAIQDDPKHQVAILVRSRSHAVDILAALRDAQLACQSIDMDPIGEKAVVKDLVSLVLALRYPHDRLHWLAVLRSPFVGLTLRDLHVLMFDCDRHEMVFARLQRATEQSDISADGLVRINRMLAVAGPAVNRAPRSQLMPWVESVWLNLGGPVACRDSVDIDTAERALQALFELEAQGDLWQKSAIETAMDALFAAPQAEQDCQIQIMTLHKSKGLEFDTVILPALERKPRADSTQLLNWFESSLQGKPQLLLAPFEQAGLDPKQRDPINALVRTARQRCDEEEKKRLLYVACTRARRTLHLVGHVSHDAKGNLKTPIKASLLHALWPILESEYVSSDKAHQLQIEQTATTQTSLDIDQPQRDAPAFERVCLQGEPPAFDVFTWQHQPRAAEVTVNKIEFSWAGRDARDIGTIVHHQLQLLAENAGALDSIDTEAITTRVISQLKQLGIRTQNLNAAGSTVIRALQNTLADSRGRWILSEHSEARSEWALSVALPAVAGSPVVDVQNVVIDRTFVDEQGTRWIIDFKTGDHQGGQLERFLDEEQARYADQLERYADIIRRIDQRPIRVGLYFPLLKAWREWQPAEA